MLKEETVEREIRHFIAVVSEGLRNVLFQLGVQFEAFFGKHPRGDDAFEFGKYSLVGCLFSGIGIYSMIYAPFAYPPIEIIAAFLTIVIIGLYIYLK